MESSRIELNRITTKKNKMKKKGTPLNDLENQRIDSSKVLGGQKQLSSEFVNTVEDRWCSL